MKTSAEKSSSTTPSTATQAKSQPFFAKAGGGGFFETPVQAKLKMGEPGDKFEREADSMAGKVVQKTEAQAVQHKCTECGATDKAQRKPLADSITPFVHRKEGAAVQQKCAACEAKDKVQRKEESVSMQEEKPLQKAEEKEEPIQAKTTGGTPDPTASVESSLSASKGQGSPLPDATRSGMESGFGVDFGNVRIHTGSAAVGMSKSLHAQAFTHGNNIYFNEGKYNPATTEGKTLLAHELTHTVQQGASVQRKPMVAPDASPHIQREEETEDLQKELEQADKAARDAIDPGPARQTRAEAAEVQAQTAKKAQSKHAQKKGSGSKKTGKKPVGTSASAKKAKAAAMVAQEDALKQQLGAVGKDLSDASAFACAKADEKTGTLAANEQTHDDADQKQQQTDGAVVPPTQEGQAMSNTEQVTGLDAAAPPQPDKEAARRTMTESLGAAMPTSIEEVNEFESQGKAQVVGNQVLGAVSADVGQVQDKYNDIEQPAAPKPVEQPTELPAQESAPNTPALNLGKGAVPALQLQHTDVKAFDSQSDDLLQKEGIPEEQLNMVDSGDLGEAKKERKGLKKKVAEEPAKIQQEAKTQTQQVEKDLQQEETKGKTQMRQKRKGGLNDTRDKQQKTKTALEKKREEVTVKINGIYERAKKSVTTKLGNLEKQNLAAFDAGQQSASTTFEREVKRDINAWKIQRYSGRFGSLKWLKDALMGIDEFPEVQQALTRGRENYIRRIDALIVSIDNDNQRVIKECKQELSSAQKEIQDYVKTLSPALKATGQAALKEMKSKLAEMDKFIDEQKDKLREKLCSKREEAIKAIDKKIEKMKEEMSGALSKLGNLILDALVKFFKWALAKAGYSPDKLMEIINKGKVVLKKIVTSPGEFFSNLAKAVKGGVNSFKNNIEKHLINGMMGWLTGAMSDAGLQLPTTWDLKGIFFLLLQILNLTKDAILKKLSDKIGRPIVEAAKGMTGFVKRVMDEGPMALWEMLMEQAETLKEKVLETIRNWVSVEMIKQGIIKLVSMLNPVGAIVQLIIGIYNAVMFFVENWSRIVEFVKTIFGSIADIALGRLGGAMTAIEKALGLTIPIILNFIARMLGLSGIGKAVRKAIEAVRGPIDKIVDKGLVMVGKFVKEAVAKVKGVFSKDKKTSDKSKGAPDTIGEVVPFKTTKESHKLYIKRVGASYKIIVASVEGTPSEKIAKWKNELAKDEWKDREDAKKKIQRKIVAVEKALALVEKDAKKVEENVEKGKPAQDANLKSVQHKLAEAILVIEMEFEAFDGKGEEFGTKEKPWNIVWHKVATSQYPEIKLLDHKKQDWVTILPEQPQLVTVFMSEQESTTYSQIKSASKKLGDLGAQLYYLDKEFKSLKKRPKRIEKLERQIAVEIENKKKIQAEVDALDGKPGVRLKRLHLRWKGLDIDRLESSKADAEDYEINRDQKNKEIEETKKNLDSLNEDFSKLERTADGVGEEFKLGLEDKFRVFPGKIIGPKPSVEEKDSRVWQPIVRKRMTKGKYEMDGKDVDHAVDLSVGGKDVMENLWPVQGGKEHNPPPDQMVDVESGKDVKLGGKGKGLLITGTGEKHKKYFHGKYFKIIKTK